MTKIFPAPEEVRDVNDDNASTEFLFICFLHHVCLVRTGGARAESCGSDEGLGRSVESGRDLKRKRRKINSVFK